MEYYVKSVVPIIESNYDKFTTVERNIADFFIQNRKKVDFSSKSISELNFTAYLISRDGRMTSGEFTAVTHFVVNYL